MKPEMIVTWCTAIAVILLAVNAFLLFRIHHEVRRVHFEVQSQNLRSDEERKAAINDLLRREGIPEIN
jgi:cell division protein FtsL